MTDRCDTRDETGSPPGRPWYIIDIVLFGGFVVVYAATYAFASLSNYLGGLRNAPAFGFLTFCGLHLLIVIWLLALLVRLFTGWPRHIRSWRRLGGLYLLTFMGLAVWLILPFTGLRRPGYEMFTLGFRRYVKTHADVESIRAWLNTVPTDQCMGQMVRVRCGGWPDAVDWPQSIRSLEPGYVQLSRDKTGHPVIRLEWGGALARWGFVVGGPDMEIPRTEPSRWRQQDFGGRLQWMCDHGEYRLPLALGAYVWHDIQ